MDQSMHLPYKVSTTTSNFVIGITAAASAGVYFNQGYVEPGLTMPVMLGVLAGALAGARILTVARSQLLRLLFKRRRRRARIANGLQRPDAMAVSGHDPERKAVFRAGERLLGRVLC